MWFLWLICCAFSAVVIELLAGGYGLVLPVFLVTSFYFTVVRGWREPLPVLMVMGTILDLAVGRGVPAMLLLLLPVQALGQYWRKFGDCRSAGAQALPGLAMGLVIGTGLVLVLRLPGSGWGLGLLSDTIRVTTQAVVGSALLLPLECKVLDRAAKAMALSQYRKVRQGGGSDWA